MTAAVSASGEGMPGGRGTVGIVNENVSTATATAGGHYSATAGGDGGGGEHTSGGHPLPAVAGTQGSAAAGDGQQLRVEQWEHAEEGPAQQAANGAGEQGLQAEHGGRRQGFEEQGEVSERQPSHCRKAAASCR